MRRRYPSTGVLDLVTKKARTLLDARIDAAVVEYAEILMDATHIDFREIEERISEAKQGGFPPPPRWRTDHKTVKDVPEARGGFRW